MLDTHEARRRHVACIEYGTWPDPDERGRYRLGFRYVCPRCQWVSRTMKHRQGADLQADRHLLSCPELACGPSGPIV